MLAQANVYTGDVIINNASTLAAAEAQGDKLGIVNGNVYITQTSTAVDAAKLQAVASKFITVTGAVSYTHSGTGVTAVNFDKLASAGSLKLDQEAPVNLAELVSAGAVIIVDDTKLTSVNMPVLTSVTSFNDGTTANSLGGSKVTSIDLGSLPRYTQGALTLELSTTGDTTLDLASLTTTAETTGLVEKLDLTVTGGDDLSLPLFVKGDISATNVKSLVLPKFIYTASTDGTLAVTASKLESIAMHEVRGSFSLANASKLASVDFIGTIDTSVTSRSVGGSVTISGTNPSLTKASFAGILAGASVTGATDLVDLTTSGMIRAFTLDGSDDITTLTLGHTNITGITGTNGENAGNASSLTIQNNDALTSFSASELVSLGTLIVKDNASLTAFTLKSTLSLGTALTSAGAAASETVSVDISGNDLTGSVQQASAFNVSPAVTGKITQASLNGISTYLKAAEAAIKHGDLTVAATGADATGWDRTTGLYTASVTSGGANTGYVLTSANVVIDNITANLDADGVDAGASSDYNVIAVTTPGVGQAAQGETQAKATAYFAKNAGVSYTVAAAGASVSLTPASTTYASDIATLVGDAEFAAFGVGITHTTGLNKRVKLTFAGTTSTTSVLSMTWNEGAVSHTVTATAGSTTRATAITALANAFNTYNLGTASATLTDAQAVVEGANDMAIYVGTYSGTTLKVDIDGTATFPGVTVASTPDANNTDVTAAYSIVSDEAFTATATSSSTTTLSTGLNLSVTINTTAATAVLTPTTAHAALSATGQAVVTDSGKFLNDHSVSTAAVTAVAANITMRATWL